MNFRDNLSSYSICIKEGKRLFIDGIIFSFLLAFVNLAQKNQILEDSPETRLSKLIKFHLILLIFFLLLCVFDIQINLGNLHHVKHNFILYNGNGRAHSFWDLSLFIFRKVGGRGYFFHGMIITSQEIARKRKDTTVKLFLRS